MSLFGLGHKPVVGMIHLPALPGSVLYAGEPFERIVERAVADARTLAEAGIDAALIQNTHDIPTIAPTPPETLACMTVIAREITRERLLPLGINVRKNDAAGPLAIAAATGAEFVRVKIYVGAAVTPEGIVQGSAAEALRTRQRLGTATDIWADLVDRTSTPLVDQPVGETAHWAVRFGGARAVIVTGLAWEETLAQAKDVRRIRSDVPLVIGGGVNAENIGEAFANADGIIVGSSLEEHPFTGPISISKARVLVAAAQRVG